MSEIFEIEMYNFYDVIWSGERPDNFLGDHYKELISNIF